ncbi:MAG: DegT/DnrJ/EryC1/StrS family aminotransferase, partial [bacterium]
MSKEKKGAAPLLDLDAQYRKIGGEVRKAVRKVLESGQFILGPEVQSFEEEAASYLRCETAIGVASGSDALLLSLMALGIGPDDAVLVSPFTFFSTVSSITRLGATPLFVDIDPGNFLMDSRKVEVLLRERCRSSPDGTGLLDARSGCQVKALMPVHLFGQCSPMSPLLSLAKKYRLRIIEDVAQAFGARASLPREVTKAAGTLGDLGCFSFFPTKILGGAGDGGLVTTNQKELARKVRMLRVHGQSAKYRHEAIG